MRCISSPIKRTQLSAKTPSNGLVLPKKGKTVGYKSNLTSQKTSLQKNVQSPYKNTFKLNYFFSSLIRLI